MISYVVRHKAEYGWRPDAPSNYEKEGNDL